MIGGAAAVESRAVRCKLARNLVGQTETLAAHVLLADPFETVEATVTRHGGSIIGERGAGSGEGVDGGPVLKIR